MDVRDYPVDVRADYPQRSSRLWAVLTIFWIKALALIPHFFALAFLGIAQFVVALVAQFVVAFKGEYPAGMHEFVTGVLRWQTRVSAFFLSVTDRYPPFSFRPLDDYPVDVTAVRPTQPSRTYAIFTIVVEILAIVIGIALAVWLFTRAVTTDLNSSTGTSGNYSFNYSSFGGGLVLRQLAAIPHYIVLLFVGIVAAIIWIVVQWVILVVARFPYGMWELEAGYVRWVTRVNAYALGLIDCYPPFSMQPSVGPGGGALPAAPPPMTGTWPQAPAPQPPAMPATPPPPPAPHPPAPESPAAQPATSGPPVPEVPGAQVPPAPVTQPEPPQAPAPPGSGA